MQEIIKWLIAIVLIGGLAVKILERWIGWDRTRVVLKKVYNVAVVIIALMIFGALFG